MAPNKSGISAILGGRGSRDNPSNQLAQLSSKILIGRVTDVCLNSNSNTFKTSGEYFGIGSIEWEDVKISTSKATKKSSMGKALPLQPFIKDFPLVNEYVVLISGVGVKNPGASADPVYYYINLKLWNDNEQNASPDPLSNANNNNSPQNYKTYSEIEAGVNMEAPKLPPPLNLNGRSGGNFVENGDVKAVIPFAGDRIFEGRFGNSIRLGSTAKTGGDITNNWSNSGKEGSPITILKNGQNASITGPGFIPVAEDINLDPTSIYLTSTQQIPIVVATTEVKSNLGQTIPFSGMVRNTPPSPQTYNNSQILLNSRRLLLNSSRDSIILSATKSNIIDSWGDSAIRSKGGNVNILSPKGNIALGETNASEAVILGTSFIKLMDTFLGSYGQLLQAMSKEPTLSISAAFAYTSYENSIQKLRAQLSTMLSEKVKVS